MTPASLSSHLVAPAPSLKNREVLRRRKDRERRQSKCQGYSDLWSKAKRETWESLILKEKLSGGPMLIIVQKMHNVFFFF